MIWPLTCPTSFTPLTATDTLTTLLAQKQKRQVSTCDLCSTSSLYLENPSLRYVLICITLILSDVEHLSRYAYCHLFIFSGRMSSPLPIFESHFLLSLLLLNCRCSPCGPDINSLSDFSTSTKSHWDLIGIALNL